MIRQTNLNLFFKRFVLSYENTMSRETGTIRILRRENKPGKNEEKGKIAEKKRFSYISASYIVCGNLCC
jgi:hypothetical protein